jgi:hypothetical protein
VAVGIRIVREQEAGALHSRTMEKRVAAAKSAKVKRLERTEVNYAMSAEAALY